MFEKSKYSISKSLLNSTFLNDIIKLIKLYLEYHKYTGTKISVSLQKNSILL